MGRSPLKEWRTPESGARRGRLSEHGEQVGLGIAAVDDHGQRAGLGEAEVAVEVLLL